VRSDAGTAACVPGTDGRLRLERGATAAPV